MTPREHDVMRKVEDHYWWYQALRQHVANSIAPSSAVFSVLDAGCGTGGMLATLRAKFPDADLTGIDESEHALELAASRDSGARLLPASVHQLPFPENIFDFVLSLDVWSHAGVDDSLAARETHRVLRPGGRLIVNLAAFESLKGAHDCAVDVDRRYRSPQVRALLQAANFQIETLTYWNAVFTLPIALLRWASRFGRPGESRQSDFRQLPPLLNSGLKAVAALELSASRHLSLPFGTSVFAIAQKHG